MRVRESKVKFFWQLAVKAPAFSSSSHPWSSPPSPPTRAPARAVRAGSKSRRARARRPASPPPRRPRPWTSFRTSCSCTRSATLLEVDILWPRWVARIGVTRSTQACVSGGRPSQCTDSELPLLRLPRLVHTSFASFLFARWCRSVPSLLYIYYTTRFLPPAYFTRLQCNNNTRSVFLSRISLSV